MYHIIVNTPFGEENRGKASNTDELYKLLQRKEIKSIYEHEAYDEMEKIFKTANNSKNQDSFIYDIKGITVNFVTNGYEVTTLVFYF